MTSHLNAQTNLKKLQFGAKKCHKMHIGKNNVLCNHSSIDTWTLEKPSETIKSDMELIDKEGDTHELELVGSDTYLGDVIQTNGKNDLNIKARTEKGHGAVNQIVKLLEELCLGPYYYQAANVLRNSLLLSSLLSNSESWYNLTQKDVINLESIDEILLRKIFSSPSTTPKELLYLESGNIPIRFCIMARRLNFLWYILNEEEHTLIKQFFNAQINNPVKNDWVSTVQKDLQDLDIKMNLEEISVMSKVTFKELVKSKVKSKALEYLQKLQQKHSKSINLHFESLELQEYLKPEGNMTIQMKAFVFSLRSRMVDVKCNYKVGKTDLKCRKCLIVDEDQEHLLNCVALSDNSVISSDIPSYQDLFTNDKLKIKSIGQILHAKFILLSKPCAQFSSAAVNTS